jgi:hypothetical protein
MARKYVVPDRGYPTIHNAGVVMPPSNPAAGDEVNSGMNRNSKKHRFLLDIFQSSRK